MTKLELLEKLGTLQAIADLFSINRQAVQQWPDDEPIPELRLYQLREMRPQWFRKEKRA